MVIVLGKGDKMTLNFFYYRYNIPKAPLICPLNIDLSLIHPIIPTMENTIEPLDARLSDSTQEDLTLTEEIAKDWLGTANWALFFAILLFLSTVFFAFLALLSLKESWMGGLVMLGLAAVFFVPAFLLSRFRNYLKKALYHESPDYLEMSFRAFRHFYLLFGILTIAATLLYAGYIAYGIIITSSQASINNF